MREKAIKKKRKNKVKIKRIRGEWAKSQNPNGW